MPDEEACREHGHVRVSNNGEPERCVTCAAQRRSETVREEWRVSGIPGWNLQPYSFTFGNPNEADREGTPESRARRFVEMVQLLGHDDLVIERRTIVESEWERVDA